MKSFIVRLDGREVKGYTRLRLHAAERMSLYPPLHRLTLDGLSESERVLLLCGRAVSVALKDGCGSVLAEGTVTDVIDDRTGGRRQTTVLFSPVPDFGAARVSLLLPAGIDYGEAVRRVCAASSVPLSANARSEARLEADRPVYGYTADVLCELCAEAGLVPFLSGGAVHAVPPVPERASLFPAPGDLYEAAVTGRDLITVSAAPKGYPAGGALLYEGRPRRVLRVRTEADTAGETVCELTLR
ncbi:MAG: hypothetical protein Q4G19_02780 [Clostridia bacterium]|nr:hypothetical protein [Clostridia bacterium]